MEDAMIDYTDEEIDALARLHVDADEASVGWENISTSTREAMRGFVQSILSQPRRSNGGSVIISAARLMRDAFERGRKVGAEAMRGRAANLIDLLAGRDLADTVREIPIDPNA